MIQYLVTWTAENKICTKVCFSKIELLEITRDLRALGIYEYKVETNLTRKIWECQYTQ